MNPSTSNHGAPSHMNENGAPDGATALPASKLDAVPEAKPKKRKLTRGPVAKRLKLSDMPTLPDGYFFGCSRYRYGTYGCSWCRARLGVTFVPSDDSEGGTWMCDENKCKLHPPRERPA